MSPLRKPLSITNCCNPQRVGDEFFAHFHDEKGFRSGLINESFSCSSKRFNFIAARKNISAKWLCSKKPNSKLNKCIYMSKASKKYPSNTGFLH